MRNKHDPTACPNGPIGLPHLDLIRIHRCVGNEDLGILNALGLSYAKLLVDDETLVYDGVNEVSTKDERRTWQIARMVSWRTEEGIAQASTRLLDDEDALQIGGASEAHHSIHSQLGKVLALIGQHLRAQRSPRNVHQILAEPLCIRNRSKTEERKR